MTQSDGPETASEDGHARHQASRGARHAVLIGINAYQDPQVRDLQFACADAQAMYDLLTDPLRGRYNPDNVTLLLDEEATKKRILATLRYELREAIEPEDTVVIYFAGHGMPTPDVGDHPSADGMEKFLVPHDGTLGMIGLSGISMEELRKNLGFLKARQIICLLDCCFSGAAGGRTTSDPQFQARATLTDEFLGDLSGEDRLVMTACGVNEVSLESSEEEHGLFTKYVIEGLSGAADTDGDGVVGVAELYDYVHREVARHARGLRGKMTPVLNGSARSMRLTDYEGPELKKAKELDASATEAADSGEFDRAEELWNEVLSLYPASQGAREGLEGLVARRDQLRLERSRMRHVFISYAHEDRSYAKKMAAVLEAEGWPVWWDHEIHAGEAWRREITKALKAAGCVIVLWSEHVVGSDSVEGSEFVMDEASRAKDRGILLPARIENVEIPVGFGTIQTEDLLEWDEGNEHPSVQRLIVAVDRMLARSGPRPESEWESAGGQTQASGAAQTIVGSGTTTIPLDSPQFPDSMPWAPAPGQVPASAQAPPALQQEIAESPPLPDKEPWVGPDWLRRLSLRAQPMLTSKTGIVGLLFVFFMINWGETTLENVLPDLPWEDEFTVAFHWFEGRFDFLFHDLISRRQAYGYTLSYFGLFPFLLLYPAILLARRNHVDGFRVYSLAIILDYVFTLPFYVLLPVNE